MARSRTGHAHTLNRISFRAADWTAQAADGDVAESAASLRDGVPPLDIPITTPASAYEPAALDWTWPVARSSLKPDLVLLASGMNDRDQARRLVRGDNLEKSSTPVASMPSASSKY